MDSAAMIDTNATVRQVREFMTDDLPRLQVMAHIRLSSVSWDNMPRHHSNENVVETRMTHQAQAQAYLDAIVEALAALPDMQQKLIKLKYLDGLQWQEISERVNLSIRRLQEILNEALVSFSYAFMGTFDLRVIQK